MTRLSLNPDQVRVLWILFWLSLAVGLLVLAGWWLDRREHRRRERLWAGHRWPGDRRSPE